MKTKEKDPVSTFEKNGILCLKTSVVFNTKYLDSAYLGWFFT